jgi:Basophilic leukemia-expressed protein Bles03
MGEPPLKRTRREENGGYSLSAGASREQVQGRRGPRRASDYSDDLPILDEVRASESLAAAVDFVTRELSQYGYVTVRGATDGAPDHIEFVTTDVSGSVGPKREDGASFARRVPPGRFSAAAGSTMSGFDGTAIPTVVYHGVSMPISWLHVSAPRPPSRHRELEDALDTSLLVLQQRLRSAPTVRTTGVPKMSAAELFDFCSDCVADRGASSSGKWLIFCYDAEKLDETWRAVAAGVTQNQLGPSAKVSPFPLLGSGPVLEGHGASAVMCVYVNDFRDAAEVLSVATELRRLLPGSLLQFKCDLLTMLLGDQCKLPKCFWRAESGQEIPTAESSGGGAAAALATLRLKSWNTKKAFGTPSAVQSFMC